MHIARATALTSTGGRIRAERLQRRRVARGDVPEELAVARPLKRAPAREHLIEQNPGAVDVDALIERARAAGLLGAR